MELKKHQPRKLFNLCQFMCLDRDGDGSISTEECMEMIMHRCQKRPSKCQKRPIKCQKRPSKCLHRRVHGNDYAQVSGLSVSVCVCNRMQQDATGCVFYERTIERSRVRVRGQDRESARGRARVRASERASERESERERACARTRARDR